MKLIKLFAIAAVAVPATVGAVDLPKDSIIQMTTAQMGRLYKTTSPARVGVHDPSIVPVTDADETTTYYIFGSHRACGRSADLRGWTWQTWYYGIPQANGSVTRTESPSNVFKTNQVKTVTVLKDGVPTSTNFGTYDAEAWRWTESNPSVNGNQWAPDVIWNPHLGKWCMYMSLNGDAWRSVIVLLTADNVTGPYVYQGPVVFSGFQWGTPAGQTYKQTDLELVLGTLSSLPARYAVGGYWGNRWPNNIDPCTFFDEAGELWMAYGSWSGGIYMLRLDKQTGLRDYTYTFPGVNNNSDGVTSDPYFGKKISGGFYSSGEGAYIEHIGKYYYLFVTNGGLEAAGGYEMHYFRSANPDGPYVDATGTNAIHSRYYMNYGPDATTTRGMKIVGSHKWVNMRWAEVSQGHNSLLEDADGRAYLIYHTRFNSGNEGFENRVHQLFINESGWLVASPFEFNGRSGTYSEYTQGMIDTTAICTTNDIVGTYKVMIHPYKVDYENMAYSTEAEIEMKANGQISGDYYGTWKVKRGTSLITLHIRPRGTTTFTDYQGVILPQMVSCTNMPAVCFTAISTSGVSVWGANVDGNYAVDCTYQGGITLPVTARQFITADIDLSAKPTMYWGTTMTWKSSHPELLSDEGKLMVPYYQNGDTTTLVGLTYTLQKDNYAYSYTRTVRVRTMKSELPRVAEDVNGDGLVDTADVLAIYDYMQNHSDEDTPSTNHDVNGDGLVDTADVLMVYKHMQEQ